MNNIYLNFAKQIAYKAGEIMLKYFTINNDAHYKEDETIVTKADNEINSYLIKMVKEKFPEHSVDGEEEKFGKSNYIWVCDPIDGTAMYARQIPVAVFSLALVIDGEPIVGVIYDPFTDSLYHAVKGEGAYKNNKKINVNKFNLSDKQSIAHYDMWPQNKYNKYDAIKELGNKTYFISIGSIARASASVASGDLTVAIFPLTKHKNCDVAAAKVIVEEAGGIVTDIFGKSQRYDQDINGVIMSNGIVHNEVLESLRKNLMNLSI